MLVALLDQVEQELDRLAGDAPLAALRAISRLEHVIAEAGYAAAYGAEADARSGTLIGPAGCPSTKAADAYSASLCAAELARTHGPVRMSWVPTRRQIT
ncbi:hypothetical protein ACFVIZ_20105 [Streptomyces anulatus]|uniref:hypothetical protein n=1 Tax=Streptomyces anulatus TaxID=1892 RepID=UPI0036319780